MRRILLAVISVFVFSTAVAQYHDNAWFRATVSFILPKKLAFEAEFQHRRQNGFNNTNMFDRTLMFSERNWIHYQHTKNIRFSVSPFAYYANYKIIQKQTDEEPKPNHEFRFSAAVFLQNEIYKNLMFGFRSAAEYRLFTNSSDIVRLRNRLGLSYTFTQKIKGNLYDEFFFNVSGVSSAHFFDQNRVLLSVEYTVLPNLKIELGYLYIFRLLNTNSSTIQENNLVLNFSYQVKKRTKMKL